MKNKNKWRNWFYETKYSSVRRKIKRKTHKADRRIESAFLREQLIDYFSEKDYNEDYCEELE